MASPQSKQPATALRIPTEYDETAYVREVLQIEINQIENSSGQSSDDKIDNVGIVSLPIQVLPSKLSLTSRESDKTNVSIHVRTLSSASFSSSSTAISSKMSSEILKETYTVRRKKEVMARMDVKSSDGENPAFLDGNGNGSTISSQVIPYPATLTRNKSYQRVKDRFRTKIFKSKREQPHPKSNSHCNRCQEAFQDSLPLSSLACNHTYCKRCLQTLIMQACQNQNKMPPRCCGQLISGIVIKNTLKEEDRTRFLRSISQLRANWESQVLCPNIRCAEVLSNFIAADQQDPQEIVCQKCRLCICSSCLGTPHVDAKQCPSEWERDTTSQLNENKIPTSDSKCYSKKQNTEPYDHIPLEGQSKIHGTCNAPCNKEIEKPDILSLGERKGMQNSEVESFFTIYDDSHPTEKFIDSGDNNRAGSKKQINDCVEISLLRARQLNERDRFHAFERKMKWCMNTRHAQERVKAQEIFEKRLAKIRERHSKLVVQLEDTQVAVEYEMISDFQKLEKKVKTRLRHMEAYCDAVDRNSGDPRLERIVTEKDLRQLGQQYNIRDTMYNVHQSKIKILRDKQAKQMEKLLLQQEREIQTFMAKREDLTLAEQRFIVEREGLAELFAKRKSILVKKWSAEEVSERKKLELEKKIILNPPLNR